MIYMNFMYTSLSPMYIIIYIRMEAMFFSKTGMMLVIASVIPHAHTADHWYILLGQAGKSE